MAKSVKEILKEDYDRLVAWFLRRELEDRANDNRWPEIEVPRVAPEIRFATDIAAALRDSHWEPFEHRGKHFAGIVSDRDIRIAVIARAPMFPLKEQAEIFIRVQRLLGWQSFVLREETPQSDVDLIRDQYGGYNARKGTKLSRCIGVYRNDEGGFDKLIERATEKGYEYEVREWIGADEV